MNHQLRRLTAVFAVALLALLGNLAVTQIFRAEELRQRQDNTRLLFEEYGRPRGAILLGGRPIAESKATGGTLAYERRYADGPLYAPATGFYSLVYGATGIERIYGDFLSGRDDRLAVDRLQQLLAGKQQRGGVVTLTLQSALQSAAYEALAGRTGAVVALDPATGEILALVASPTYDPNSLSSNNPAKVRAAYEKYLADANEPLANRPLTQSLPPGSTFKLVVAAAALASGQYRDSTKLPGPATLQLPQSSKRLGNWQGTACSSSGKVTLRQALEVSCNTAFAWLGMQLGDEALRAQAEQFGFNTSVETPLVAAASVFPTGLDGAQTAMSSIGQFDVRATALQMSMVASAIANRGVLMRPYLVKDLRTADLGLVESFQPQQLHQSMSAANADLLLDMMRTVVTNGTASSLRLSGLTTAGKTGTAESGTDAPPHAWMVAVGWRDGRQVAVAVVVENGGGAAEVSGNGIAGPIAAAVLKAAFP